jgi:hypothetical protein
VLSPQPHAAAVTAGTAPRSMWLFSWPLIVGALAYIFALSKGNHLLLDGDTYWHIASGKWILEHGAVPTADPFSHTMRGAAWTAHEWLSQVVLAVAHDVGSWTGVVAVTALAFAATLALLTGALLKSLEPIYALAFASLGVAMTAHHLLARPHILAMPLMMTWVIGLIRACESGRAPSLWLLPVMTVWANLHGGFTLGLALAPAFALEAALASKRNQRFASAAKSWGIFLALTATCSLITPHGIQGIWYTWETLVESSYALQTIREWQSPNFHKLQPLELWLLAGLAFALHQGLRLPPVRLLLLLGVIHLALKHVRYVELVGLLAPLFLASPLAAHWRQTRQSQQVESMDRFFQRLAKPPGQGALLLVLGVLLSWTLWISNSRSLQPPKISAPIDAVQAARDAGIKGPVLNHYGWGGYLIYSGIPPFIDGRSDMYKDDFLRRYLEALRLNTSDGLERILHDYNIEWTILTPNAAAVALLDHLPNWRRLYTDEVAVIHIKFDASTEDKYTEKKIPSSLAPASKK